MAKKEYSLFQSSIQKVASSRPGAWFFSLTEHHFDKAVLKLTNNKATMTRILAGFPVVMLTSTGAKSGLPREVPLLGIQDESEPNRIAFIASNWGKGKQPAWYYNLITNPRATVSISGQIGDYIAHEADGEEYEKYWQSALDIHKGYSLYQERAGDRHIPIMVMTPVEA